MEPLLREKSEGSSNKNESTTINYRRCGFASYHNERFKYTCEYCHHEYMNAELFESHLIKKHINILNSYIEDIKIHGDGSSRDQATANEVLTEEYYESNNIIVCDNKPKNTDNTSALLINEIISDGSSSDAKQEKHFLHACHVCGKTYKNMKFFQMHYNKHHPGHGTFKCNICGHFMKTGIGLENHIKHVHKNSNAPIFQCESCDLGFTTETRLTLHIHKVHTLETTFPCKTCGKHFINVGNMKIHERIHTGEKPFQCEICGKKFVRSNNLDVHKRRHLSDRHIKCELCDKMFYTRTSMEDHLISHTNEKNFSCEFCETKFARKGDKLKHLKMKHSQYMAGVEKKYACTICGADFALRVGFRQHMKSEHGVTLRNLNDSITIS